MGTFHDGLGEWHGMTVVVDTGGPKIVIGRCHEMDEARIVLHDADVHEDGRDALTKADWLRRAVAFGTWPRHQRLVVPMEEVTDVRLLSEIARA
jgi:hypothetical protein